MEGGALFKSRSEAKERVRAAFAAIDIHNHEGGGYTYNDANTLATEIECDLAEQLCKDSTDGMTGLLSTAKHTLTEYKVTSSIKRKDGEQGRWSARRRRAHMQQPKARDEAESDIDRRAATERKWGIRTIRR